MASPEKHLTGAALIAAGLAAYSLVPGTFGHDVLAPSFQVVGSLLLLVLAGRAAKQLGARSPRWIIGGLIVGTAAALTVSSVTAAALLPLVGAAVAVLMGWTVDDARRHRRRRFAAGSGSPSAH